ncbi:MAG: hypothetical protein ABI693_28240 [Bryobacteraceae bacterium]
MAKTMTPAQRKSSRRNGSTSRGPITEKGKKVSSINALKHGLAAEHSILPGESMGRFDDLLEDIIRRRPNAGELELALLRGLAQDLWRLERARHLSRDAHALRMRLQEDEVDEAWDNPNYDLRATVALAFELGPTGDIKNFAIYESRIHRHIKQVLQELETIEQLLPQLDEPAVDPGQEDPDEQGPHSQGPQIVPFPQPPTEPETTARTNEPETDSTPVDSSACGLRKLKAKPLAARVPYPAYVLRKPAGGQSEKVMTAAAGEGTYNQ